MYNIVKPGVTDWAKVPSKNDAKSTTPVKFLMNIVYPEHNYLPNSYPYQIKPQL